MSELDRDALLVALVLSPATYSRNRFFEMYRDPELRRVRRRASLLRGIAQHVARVRPSELGEIVRVEPAAGEEMRLVYVVPALGLRRTATLDPLEFSLLRCVISRAPSFPPALAASEVDRARVEAALQRLAPVSAESMVP